MNKQQFNFLKIDLIRKRDLKLTIDTSNYVDGWNDCVRELEKVLDMKIDDILKLKVMEGRM